MVFSAAFNNNSIMSWRLILLVSEPEGPWKKTDRIGF